MDAMEARFERHRADLLRILAVLWTMAGLGSRTTIERGLHRIVTRLLRPAEAAARRLIVVLAQTIVVTLRPFRASGPRSDGVRGRPAWMAFALADPSPRWPSPGAARRFAGIPLREDTQIGTARLATRIDALCHALDDLSAQAQRLARWTALRKHARARGKFRAVRPLRPGPPSDLVGRRGRRLRKHELHAILEDTHNLAWWALNEPKNSS